MSPDNPRPRPRLTQNGYNRHVFAPSTAFPPVPANAERLPPGRAYPPSTFPPAPANAERLQPGACVSPDHLPPRPGCRSTATTGACMSLDHLPGPPGPSAGLYASGIMAEFRALSLAEQRLHLEAHLQ